MELSLGDGKLQVHYSDRLVTLLREVRQLSALGLPVPVTIQQAAATGQKFYRHGVVLKQVREVGKEGGKEEISDFYNIIYVAIQAFI